MSLHRGIVLAAAAALCGCPPPPTTNPPLSGQFYFPTAIAQVPSVSGPDGILYVVSFNEDKRYDESSLIAVNLANVRGGPDAAFPDAGLAPLGTPVPASGPPTLTALNVSDAGLLQIQSFASQMALFPLDGGGMRLFIPSRAEGDLLHVVDAREDSLSCFGAPGANNCIATSPSLTSPNPPGDAGITDPDTKPRAPQPYGVAVSSGPAAQVFVTHAAAADDPINSGLNLDSFLVQLDANNPYDVNSPPANTALSAGVGLSAVNPSQFHSLAVDTLYSGPSDSAAVGQRFVYVTGRFNVNELTASILRIYDTLTQVVTDVGVEGDFQAIESRGVALNADESLAYVVTRTPDTLIVVSIANPLDPDGNLRIQIIGTTPLPDGPNMLQVIPRAAVGMGDLVVVACTGASTVVIYDQVLGQLVADLPAVGTQPFGIAVDNRGTAARLYVTDFGDGRVAVIDIPDLTQPQEAQVVAYLGAQQTCIVSPTDASCPVTVTP